MTDLKSMPWRGDNMSHYFTTDNTEHDYKEIEFKFSGVEFKFKTDRGVFSRDRVDYGTEVLLKGVVKDGVDLNGKKIIDMGAGYGPVGVVLAKTCGAEPLMVEVNQDALEILEDNLVLNNVQGETVTRVQYDMKDNVEVSAYITNPPFRAGKQVVLKMIEDAVEKLHDSGAFYMVVQKKQGMSSYKKEIQRIFGSVEVILKDKGYYVLKGMK